MLLEQAGHEVTTAKPFRPPWPITAIMAIGVTRDTRRETGSVRAGSQVRAGCKIGLDFLTDRVDCLIAFVAIPNRDSLSSMLLPRKRAGEAHRK